MSNLIVSSQRQLRFIISEMRIREEKNTQHINAMMIFTPFSYCIKISMQFNVGHSRLCILYVFLLVECVLHIEYYLIRFT